MAARPHFEPPGESVAKFETSTEQAWCTFKLLLLRLLKCPLKSAFWTHTYMGMGCQDFSGNVPIKRISHFPDFPNSRNPIPD